MQPNLFLIYHKVCKMSFSLISAGTILQASSIDISSVCVFRTLREQWIRAKYERKEFSEPGKSFIYEEGECVHTYMHARTQRHSF